MTFVRFSLQRACEALLFPAEAPCSLAELPPQIFPAASNLLNPELVYHPLLENTGLASHLAFFDICLRTQPHTQNNTRSTLRSSNHTHTHTHTHMRSLFVEHACTSLHKSYGIPMTTHERTHTCAHTAASLIPIKRGLVWVQCDGLPAPPPPLLTHTLTSVVRMCEANVLAAGKGAKTTEPLRKHGVRLPRQVHTGLKMEQYRIHSGFPVNVSHLGRGMHGPAQTLCMWSALTCLEPLLSK